MKDLLYFKDTYSIMGLVSTVIKFIGVYNQGKLKLVY